MAAQYATWQREVPSLPTTPPSNWGFAHDWAQTGRGFSEPFPASPTATSSRPQGPDTHHKPLVGTRKPEKVEVRSPSHLPPKQSDRPLPLAGQQPRVTTARGAHPREARSLVLLGLHRGNPPTLRTNLAATHSPGSAAYGFRVCAETQGRCPSRVAGSARASRLLRPGPLLPALAVLRGQSPVSGQNPPSPLSR